MLCLYHPQPELAAMVRDRRTEIDVYEAAALGDVDRLAEITTTSPNLASATAADGFTSLHLACYFGREASVSLLLDVGAEPNAIATNGSELQPLHSAAAARSLEIVRCLLDAGADPNARQKGGYTALMAAAMHGDEAMIRVLLDSGAEPESTSDDGQTAGEMARAKGVADHRLP